MRSPEDAKDKIDKLEEDSTITRKSPVGAGAICGIGCLAMFLVIIIASLIGANNCAPGSPEHYMYGDACGLSEIVIAFLVDVGIFITCIVILSLRNKHIA